MVQRVQPDEVQSAGARNAAGNRTATGHMAANGHTTARSANGSAVTRRPGGRVAEVHDAKRGMDVHHGLNGGRSVRVEGRDGHRIVVAERGGRFAMCRAAMPITAANTGIGPTTNMAELMIVSIEVILTTAFT